MPGDVGGKAPVPVKAAVCGLPGALSVTESDALYEPATVGLNVTWMEQLAPGARLGVLLHPFHALKFA